MKLPKTFSLSQLLICVLLGNFFAVSYVYISRAIEAEQKLHDIDVLLDRWIDARDLSHANRLQAIDELLATRKSSSWFWSKNDHKFTYKE